MGALNQRPAVLMSPLTFKLHHVVGSASYEGHMQEVGCTECTTGAAFHSTAVNARACRGMSSLQASNWHPGIHNREHHTCSKGTCNITWIVDLNTEGKQASCAFTWMAGGRRMWMAYTCAPASHPPAWLSCMATQTLSGAPPATRSTGGRSTRALHAAHKTMRRGAAAKHAVAHCRHGRFMTA